MPKPTVKTKRGLTLTRQGAADAFGVAPTTVDAWTRKGCPVMQRGSRGVEWQFNSADLHRWLCDEQVEMATGDRDEDTDSLSKRKLRAQTELAELELAKAKEVVVDQALVQRALSNAFSSLQAELRVIPGRVVRSLIGETDKVRFKEVLLEEIDRALENLAKLDLTGVEDAEAESDDEEEEDFAEEAA